MSLPPGSASPRRLSGRAFTAHSARFSGAGQKVRAEGPVYEEPENQQPDERKQGDQPEAKRISGPDGVGKPTDAARKHGADAVLAGRVSFAAGKGQRGGNQGLLRILKEPGKVQVIGNTA